MKPWTRTLIEAENSLRKLEESIPHLRTGRPVTSAETNGSAGELSDILRRCEELPKEAISAVENAWENLEANVLPDWDAAGRQVLDLLTKQAEAIAQTINLVCRGEKSGMPQRARGKLSGERARLLERARDFRDSWPWSTGNKPDDEEDAAAARRALQALPSFEALSEMAKKRRPVPEWLDED